MIVVFEEILIENILKKNRLFEFQSKRYENRDEIT